MEISEKTMAISNLDLEETEFTEEERDMIELVASVLDGATYNLLNDLLHEIKREVDADGVLNEIDLKYQSLGLTVKFLGSRAGKDILKPKKENVKKELDYYV